MTLPIVNGRRESNVCLSWLQAFLTAVFPSYFVRKYSAWRKDGSFHYIHTTSFGNYSFICVDATLSPGPKRPYNFFGILNMVLYKLHFAGCFISVVLCLEVWGFFNTEKLFEIFVFIYKSVYIFKLQCMWDIYLAEWFCHLLVSESNGRAVFDGNRKSTQQPYYLVWPLPHLNNHLPIPWNTNTYEVRSSVRFQHQVHFSSVFTCSSLTLRFSAVIFPSHPNNHNFNVFFQFCHSLFMWTSAYNGWADASLAQSTPWWHSRTGIGRLDG